MDPEPGAAGHGDQEPSAGQQLSGPMTAEQRTEPMRNAENQEDRRRDHHAGGDDGRRDHHRRAEHDDPDAGPHRIGSSRQVVRQVHP